jgi:dTDP-4-dehydrorhamnose reductase
MTGGNVDDSKIFIVGANGQLGTALRAKYPASQFADVGELDITNQQSVDAFDWSGIEIILNAAAYTNVDGAETPEGRVAAWNVNAVAVANLASVCLQYGMTLVHISSDYVFDGTQKPHTEDEPFSPLSVYGQSKAAGDIVAGLLPRHYILRATWVIGEGKNFVRTMLGLAEKGISPTVVADQVGRLTFTSELVRTIDHLLTTQAPYGTYNATNDGTPASWADITREIFADAGYDQLTVTNTTTVEYFAGKEGIAPRPLESAMDLTKLQATGFESRDWHDELKAYIAQEKAE